MSTDSWIGPTGRSEPFGTEGSSDANWSSGKVPDSSANALIDPNGGDANISATSTEDVNSIAVGGGNDELFIGGAFTVEDGSASNTNSGLIQVSAGELTFDGGTFDSTGTILLEGDTFLEFGGNTTLSGTGSIEADIGGNGALIQDNGVVSSAPIVINDEDISGDYEIDGLNFINDGTLETNNNTSSSGGNVVIATSNAVGGSFLNNGTVRVDNGGSLQFGIDTIYNNNIIELDSTGRSTALLIGGDVTIEPSDINGSNIIALAGTAAIQDQIESQYITGSLTLVNETLKGAGTISGGPEANLTLNNGSGSVINADNPNYGLLLDTTATTNQGTMEATGGGFLDIDSPLTNAGLIVASGGLVEFDTGAAGSLNDGTMQATSGQFLEINSALLNDGTVAANGGTVIIAANVSGSGAIDIGPNGSVWIETNTNSNITFTGEGTLYIVNTEANGGIDGMISGAVAGDTIFLNRVAFSQGDHAVWDQTSAGGGTLSIYDQGTNLCALDLAGTYNSLDFAVTSGEGGDATLITVQNTPNYPNSPGNNDEWILSDGNWVESAGPGSHPSGYNVALIGDWTGGGTDGVMWFNPATGDTDEWQLSNTQWSPSSPGSLGTHPLNGTDNASYQIGGTDDATDFFGNGIDDVLWTSTNSDGSIATDIWELNSSGTWMDSVSPGNHPAGYTVAATGDWTGDGTDGILWFNASTGNVDEWQLSDGQWSSSSAGSLGSHPANASDGNSYQIAGAGDFFGNGIDDVLWTSTNSDGTIATDIWELGSSGQWVDSVSPGNHPAGYQVAAVGDFTGTGTSDILWYSASTGDVDVWLINNGAYAGHVDLGPHPGNFQIAGVGNFTGNGTKDILWHSPS
jgi:hypothetical protein